jgi:hypothetical protein
MLWGSGIGAAAGVTGGIIQGQWRGPWKLAADAAIGAGAGAPGGYLGAGSSIAANVVVGVGSASGVANQLVTNGGFHGFNPVAVGVDRVIGGVVPGVGAIADAAGVGNVATNLGGDVLGGIGTVACAGSRASASSCQARSS